ncbi:hypothetical protein PsYK624_082280 [Phanerochaete sordida]|uniref:Protein kinase domain-containing protein n=1 Tax=Phanerochaete sordida TaxID=48140 RepID=A0A9P3GCC8_9APHY|nr:hypothetical protein PsYK624_082280 [Phanerochaete sordida]
MAFQQVPLGLISPREFLSRFMAPDRRLPSPPSLNSSRLYSCTSNEVASTTLIRVLDDSQLCPGLKFYLPKLKKRQEEVLRAESDENFENNKYGHYIPCHPAVAVRKQKETRVKSKRRSLTEYYDFGTTVLAIEAAVHPDEDPFMDLADSGTSTSSPTDNIALERRTLKASVVRARLLKSAQALFLRQHRTRLFQLVLVSGGARFILFDRAGAIVSHRFDYLKTPEILADFLWRFAHMTDATRGQDPSAALATKQQASVFTEAVRDSIRVDDDHRQRTVPGAEQSLDNLGLFPVWTIRVVNDATGAASQLVTQRPFAMPTSLCCRGTRAYLAYDLSAQRLVFFKDSWREKDSRARPEFDIYQDLRASGIPCIPEIMYGGDVLGPDGKPQRTVVDEAYDGKTRWRLTDDQLRGRLHHRLVQDIYYPLESVSDERELIQALHDTILVIEKTHQMLGILHRDISSNNVMLDSQGRCILGDWDHAGRPEPDVGAIGTVPFLSVRLLHDDTAHNELIDDLQSVFWVLNYIAVVRFAQHYHGLNVGIFDGGKPAEYVALGTDKIMAMSRHTLYEGRYRSAALNDLIRDLALSWTRFAYHENEPPAPSAGEDAEPNMLELAPQPKYWLEMFAEALRKCDAEKEAARSAIATEEGDAVEVEQEPEEPQVVRAGTKRKDIEDAPVADDDHRQVRRSKRLRDMRQQK